MKKAIVLLFFLFTTVSFGQNLILNPSFEDGQGDTPVSWFTGSADGHNPPNTTFVWEDQVSRTGDRCVSIERDGEETGGYWCQTVMEFETGEEMEFEVHALSDEGDVDFGITVVFWLAGRPIMPPVVIDSEASDQDWLRTAGTFTIPAFTDSVRVQLTFYQASGKVYFDDASLDIYDEDGISEDYGNMLAPAQLVVHPAYPNPFNPDVSIGFTLAESGSVKLRVLDSNGRLVHRSQQNGLQSGYNRMEWNANGQPTGNYLLVIEHEGCSRVVRAALVK